MGEGVVINEPGMFILGEVLRLVNSCFGHSNSYQITRRQRGMKRSLQDEKFVQLFGLGYIVVMLWLL